VQQQICGKLRGLEYLYNGVRRGVPEAGGDTPKNYFSRVRGLTKAITYIRMIPGHGRRLIHQMLNIIYKSEERGYANYSRVIGLEGDIDRAREGW
jgi:hypothetical protein